MSERLTDEELAALEFRVPPGVNLGEPSTLITERNLLRLVDEVRACRAARRIDMVTTTDVGVDAERLTDEELAKLADSLAGRDGERWALACVRRLSQGDGGLQVARWGKLGSLVAEVRAARELLAELEWAGDYHDGSEGYCPICKEQGLLKPHRPGCRLAAALGLATPDHPPKPHGSNVG